MAASACIAAQVGKNRNRVRRDLLQHPRQQKEESKQKCGQARNGAEGRVLQRGRNLDNVYDNAHREADEKQRSAEEYCGPERLTDNVNNRFRAHGFLSKNSSVESRSPDSIRPLK